MGQERPGLRALFVLQTASLFSLGFPLPTEESLGDGHCSALNPAGQSNQILDGTVALGLVRSRWILCDSLQ